MAKSDKYWTEKHLEHVRTFLPTDVTAEFDEVSRLSDGDYFSIIIRRYGASVDLQLEKHSKAAFETGMPIYSVQEDRYEPRWAEKYGDFDNAIRRCIELVRNPSLMEKL